MYTCHSSLFKPKTIFQNFSKFKKTCSFLISGWPADRPGRPAQQPGRARLCTSVGRPDRSTDQELLLSGFLSRPDRSTGRRKLCFLFWDGRPDWSTESQRLFAAGLAVDRTGRPPGLQQSNGSFLFGLFWKTVFVFCFNRFLESCWEAFAGQIRCKEIVFNLFSTL